MQKVQLESWQAIELFSHLVTKFDGNREGFQLSSLSQTAFLSRKLNDYKSKSRAEKLSNEIFGKKQNAKGLSVDSHPQAVYELARAIRLSEPVIIEELKLQDIEKFINSGIASEAEPYSVGNVNYISPWLPSKRLDNFSNTNWWLYFRDRKTKHITNKEFPEGITRALVILYPFGKAEIRGYSVDNDAPEEYIGGYKLYRGNEFLQFNMKLKQSNTKDLHILIYIGTGSVSLALGQFHNVGRSIYSGTVMVEKINRTLSLHEMQNPGNFFEINDKENFESNVPLHARAFLEERQRNVMRTACKVTNINDFNKWRLEKNAK